MWNLTSRQCGRGCFVPRVFHFHRTVGIFILVIEYSSDSSFYPCSWSGFVEGSFSPGRRRPPSGPVTAPPPPVETQLHRSSPLEPPSFFFLAAPTAWKLPGQGLNLSCCFDLHLSCSHAGSLTHWATAGTLLQPVSCSPSPLVLT